MIGYSLAALLILAVVLAVGMLVTAVAAALGTFLVGAAAILFVALAIKEYCEPAKGHSETGERKANQQTS